MELHEIVSQIKNIQETINLIDSTVKFHIQVILRHLIEDNMKSDIRNAQGRALFLWGSSRPGPLGKEAALNRCREVLWPAWTFMRSNLSPN